MERKKLLERRRGIIMSKPLVSVLVAVYNVEEYLERCLDSIVNQTLDNIEIICVNDGSTDHSQEILESYKAKDARVHIVQKENGGLPSARNAGIERATGAYIGFVDADDFVEHNMFEVLYKTAEHSQSDIVICGANILPEEPRANGWLYDCLSPQWAEYEQYSADVLFYNVSTSPFLWRTLIRKELIDTNNLRLNEDVHLGEDKAFQSKVYPLAEKITVIPDKLYNYIWCREGSLMNQMVYDNPVKKVKGHVNLVCDIADTMAQYKQMGLNKAFLEWSIPFIYDDFIYIPLVQKKEFSNQLLKAFKKCDIDTYKYELPNWKYEMLQYMQEVSVEDVNNPDIAIIMFIDPNAKYVESGLKNIVNKSPKNSEIIIINSGTKSENYAILHRYLFKDKRIRLLNKGHTTYADALNIGIQIATANYITFIETYDWHTKVFPEWLEYAMEKNTDICVSLFEQQSLHGLVSSVISQTVDKQDSSIKFFENDFQNVIYKRKFLSENEIRFKNSSIVTGFEFLSKAYVYAETCSWYNKVAYVHRVMHKPDWISTEKCKLILQVFVELMNLASEKGCNYLQVKILSLINSDWLGTMIVNNTKPFKGEHGNYPKGENSQAEVVQALYSIIEETDVEYIEKHQYFQEQSYLQTLYNVINERHKFLANI